MVGGAALDSLELARHIVEVIADKKGEDVLLLDIRDVSILVYLLPYFLSMWLSGKRRISPAYTEAAAQF